MIITKIDKKKKDKQNICGEIYNGFYFPFVLPGRVLAFRNDIQNIIFTWMQTMDLPENEEKIMSGSLEVFADIFKSLHFSWVHSRNQCEEHLDVWQIFCGICTDELRREMNNVDKSIEYQTGVLYVLYLSYYTQYFNPTHIFPLPIPCSIETLDILINLSEKCISSHRYVEVLKLLSHFCENQIFVFCGFDGPQFLYRNKFGLPLSISNDSLRQVLCKDIKGPDMSIILNSIEFDLLKAAETCDNFSLTNQKGIAQETVSFKKEIEKLQHILKSS